MWYFKADEWSAIGTCFGVLVSLITVVVLYRQTQRMNRVSGFTMMQQSLKDLNCSNVTDTRGMCVLRFNHFYTLQKLRDERLISNKEWQGELAYMVWAMRMPGMLELWRVDERMYSDSLRKTINTMILNHESSVAMNSGIAMPVGNLEVTKEQSSVS